MLRQFTALSSHYKVRADATITIKLKDEGLRVLVVEVKSPHKTSERDFLKLAVEMKIMLDAMISRNVQDPVAFGVLVEG